MLGSCHGMVSVIWKEKDLPRQEKTPLTCKAGCCIGCHILSCTDSKRRRTAAVRIGFSPAVCCWTGGLTVSKNQGAGKTFSSLPTIELGLSLHRVFSPIAFGGWFSLNPLTEHCPTGSEQGQVVTEVGSTSSHS